MYESQRCDVQERWSGAALRCGSVILVQMPLKGGQWALEGEGGGTDTNKARAIGKFRYSADVDVTECHVKSHQRQLILKCYLCAAFHSNPYPFHSALITA